MSRFLYLGESPINSGLQSHSDTHIPLSYDMTRGFKPFTIKMFSLISGIFLISLSFSLLKSYLILIGSIGDSTSVKARVVHVQTVALTTLQTLVTSHNGSYSESSPKRNLAGLVAKKLLQPSNEKCLEVLYLLLHHKLSSLCILDFLAELCGVSRELSIHLSRHSNWMVSLTKFLSSCSGKHSDHKETCSVLLVLCSIVENSEDIPSE